VAIITAATWAGSRGCFRLSRTITINKTITITKTITSRSRPTRCPWRTDGDGRARADTGHERAVLAG